MTHEKATFTNEEAKIVWEELKGLQISKKKLVDKDFAHIKQAEDKEERDAVKNAFNDLRDELSQRSKSPGSLCNLLHSQLRPLYLPSGIEKSRTLQHPSLLIERFQGQEHWLWCTSDTRRVVRGLEKLGASENHLVRIQSGCIREIEFKQVKKQIYSVDNMEGFVQLVEKSKRSVPYRDTYLGAHWKLFHAPRVNWDYDYLDRYLGTIPTHLSDEIAGKV